jgi:hypothetical protein
MAGHDVAVLWSFTEIAMCEKEITAKEARKKTGEQIKLMVASLAENSALKDGKEMDINAYNIGGDYKETVLTAHYALGRTGFPAHIIHERLLPGGVLKNYKTLVIVGQTFAFPPAVSKAISDFAAAGGKIVTDESTTVKFDGAITAATNLKGLSYRFISAGSKLAVIGACGSLSLLTRDQSAPSITYTADPAGTLRSEYVAVYGADVTCT